MRALITGAAGFLGRHVMLAFKNDGWDVTGLDLTEHPFDWADKVTGDFTNPELVDREVAKADVVVHVGAIGDVYLAGEDPGLAAQVNVVGTTRIANAAAENAKRVVYASTWEVYGDPQYQPMDEDHPTNPDHPYNITKLGGEAMLFAACKLKGLSAMSLRLGTAYGSGLRANSVFRIFLDRARAGEPIVIQGDGSQGRQFTHASDIARAFVLAAHSDESGLALNIVAPELVSIKELAELVVARHPTELTFGPPRAGDVPPAKVSAERAADVLGWRAEMPFDKGLAEFMDGIS